MSDTTTTEPVLNRETLRDLRVYSERNDDGEHVYLSLWAVHGTETEVEYPLVSWSADQTVYSSTDPSYSDMSDDVVGEPFYTFLGGQAARIAEEGPAAFDTMSAFVPEELTDAEAWLAQMCLGAAYDDEFPYEILWAIERGIQYIEADIDAEEVTDEVSDGDANE